MNFLVCLPNRKILSVPTTIQRKPIDMEEGEHDEANDESCVKSILGHKQCSIRSSINTLVQLTSEVECRGSSIYTLALFRCLETHTFIPAAFFKQGFVYSCFVAAGSKEPPPYKPDPICERFKQEAMLHVPTAGFDLKYMGQTINALARRYLTTIKNSFV
jgi:hypothetical protein